MFLPGRIRSKRWRDVAIACQDAALTVPRIADALGTTSGSIQALVRSMRREGLLDEAESSARGQALILSPAGRVALRQAEVEGSVASLFRPGERLLFLLDEGVGIPAELLIALTEDPNLRWAARLDSRVHLVVSFGTGSAVSVDRAQNLSAAHGLRAFVGRADEFFDAEQLGACAAEIASKPRKELPAGSSL